jgi:hypothetical protein
MSAKEKIAAFE